MGQRVGWHRDQPGARRMLLDELAQFKAAKKVSITVVFDGAPEQHFPDGSSYRGVRLYYAERNSNADERIKSFVEATRERRTLFVVTSDRALADYVRRCGAQVIRSGDFRQRLEEANAITARGAHADNDEIDKAGGLNGWMRYFGVAPEDEEER